MNRVLLLAFLALACAGGCTPVRREATGSLVPEVDAGLPDAGDANEAGDAGDPDALAPDAAAPLPAWPPSLTFAMRTVNFGDLDPQGAKIPEAWRSVGVELDRTPTRPGDPPRCATRKGASAHVLDEGDNGIDNSFAHNIVPLLNTADPPLSVDIDRSIKDGDLTLLFSFFGLPAGPDAASVSSAVLLGVAPMTGPSTHAMPSEDQWSSGQTVWDLISTQFSSQDPPVPLSFQTGSVGAGQWTTGRSDVTLVFPVRGILLQVPLHDAIVGGQIAGDQRRLGGGVLGGMVSTEELVTVFSAVAPRISPSFCSPGLVKFLVDGTLRPASDMLLDGTRDPGRPCDAISFGLRFEAYAAELGQVVPPQSSPPVPCAPAAGAPDGGLVQEWQLSGGVRQKRTGSKGKPSHWTYRPKSWANKPAPTYAERH